MSTLDRYLGEREEQSSREERELQFEENHVLEEICTMYKGWMERTDTSGWEHRYRIAIDSIPSSLEYTARDVERFSNIMKIFEDNKHFDTSGLFLSALVNKGKDEEYILSLEHLEKPLDLIGYYNKKQLTVKSACGRFVACNMEDGSLTVHGDACGGVAWYMSGGMLTIRGDVHGTVGWEMSGGTVDVKGGIKNIAYNWRGGKIYECGELVRTEDES